MKFEHKKKVTFGKKDLEFSLKHPCGQVERTDKKNYKWYNHKISIASANSDTLPKPHF